MGTHYTHYGDFGLKGYRVVLLSDPSNKHVIVRLTMKPNIAMGNSASRRERSPNLRLDYSNTLEVLELVKPYVSRFYRWSSYLRRMSLLSLSTIDCSWLAAVQS